MTTTLERSTAVAKELRKGKMQTEPYKRGPLGAAVMALRVTTLPSVGGAQGIRLWTGMADFNITDINPKHRQAVVALDEAKRKVTRQYNIGSWRELSDRDLTASARRNFPVTMPGSPRFHVQEHSVEVENTRSGKRWHYRVTASMTSPATEMTVLMGLDETSHFISALPERVGTVPEAHEVLRPNDVPEGSLRQGEWFFIPATEKEIAQVVASLSSETRIGKNMERSSSHRGLVVPVPGLGRFTIGTVQDSRSGRHAPLLLKDWHRIVRNTEIVISEPRSRYWD
jgi:hypothetical protein